MTSDLFRRAALAAGAAGMAGAGAPPDEDVARLFRGLGLGRPDAPGPIPAEWAKLFGAASRFERLFRLHAPMAPGLVAYGAHGVVGGDPGRPNCVQLSVSGAGRSQAEALASCIGEGVEYLSGFERPSDIVHRGPWRAERHRFSHATREACERLFGALRIAPEDLAWVSARSEPDGEETIVPSCLALRPVAASGAAPLLPGTGCAAGPTLAAASLHGLLEVVERDAVALWWLGGRPARSLDLGPDEELLLAAFRQDVTARHSWVVELTTEFSIPVIAGLSSTIYGDCIAAGFAAKLSLRAAVASAILELCQVELADAVVEAKLQERGEEGLGPRDRSHRRRSTELRVEACELLRGRAPDEPAADRAVPTDPEAAFAALAERGHEAFVVDLTRPELGIPAARTLVPALQGYPGLVRSARLEAVCRATGGGDLLTRGVPIL